MLPNNAAKLRKKRQTCSSQPIFSSAAVCHRHGRYFSDAFNFSPANVRQYFHSAKHFPEKSSSNLHFFQKGSICWIFIIPVVVGVIENGRIVALSHCRIVAFSSCTCANSIYGKEEWFYIYYIIFIYYISIYINNRAHAGEVVRQCDNATMRRSFPRAEKAFPHTEIPFLRVRRPEFS